MHDVSSLRKHPGVHLHKPGWRSPLHTQATPLGDTSVQHVTHSTKQHEVKSSTRENEAIERRGKPEMYEAAGGITRTLFYSKLVS